MAHEIETHGDQAAAIFTREDAWHRLGTTVPDGFTAATPAGFEIMRNVDKFWRIAQRHDRTLGR